MDIIAFGNRVRAARERLGITQEDLAARVGMSPSHMSIVERGVKVPRMDTVVKLANELDVSADYLLQDSVAQSRNNQLLSSIMDLPERERDRLLDKAHRAPKQCDHKDRKVLFSISCFRRTSTVHICYYLF